MAQSMSWHDLRLNPAWWFKKSYIVKAPREIDIRIRLWSDLLNREGTSCGSESTASYLLFSVAALWLPNSTNDFIVFLLWKPVLVIEIHRFHRLESCILHEEVSAQNHCQHKMTLEMFSSSSYAPLKPRSSSTCYFLRFLCSKWCHGTFSFA